MNGDLFLLLVFGLLVTCGFAAQACLGGRWFKLAWYMFLAYVIALGLF